jgi:tRNA A37 threonylcarbamoyladenosine modification protein TsaB
MRRWLYIDTRSHDQAGFGWLEESGDLKLWDPRPSGPGLMSAVLRRLKPKQLAQAQGICVVRGPGSFSSIRTGVLVANLLARIFRLPLYALEGQEAGETESLLTALKHRQPTVYAEPVYDSEPNITMAKHL